MGWVVKEWSSDGLERLLAEHARDSLRATRQAAARDARRARRIADRAAAEADAHLDALESLGRELQLVVRTRRAALRSATAGDAPAAPPPPRPRATRPALSSVPPDGGRERRGGRASMRSSPLAELFRPTEPRRPRPDRPRRPAVRPLTLAAASPQALARAHVVVGVTNEDTFVLALAAIVALAFTSLAVWFVLVG